jgi:hypothetical protein
MLKLSSQTCASLVSAALILATMTVSGGGKCEAQTTPTAVAREANPADVSSLNSIISALYDVISGPAGKKRDWDRFRSLFAPGARLIPAVTRQGKVEALVIDPDGYITRSAPFLEKEGFYEHEIARRTETFGHITHIFSTYESKHTAEDKTPFARGINSIQLLNDGKRWWIVTVYWDGERPDNPLPDKYLKTEGR